MNNFSEFKDKTKEYLSKQVIDLISNLSDENLKRIMFLAEKTTPKTHRRIATGVKKAFERGHPSLDLAKNFLRNVDKNCRDKFVINFILNGLILNQKKRNRNLEENNLTVPISVLISPTMRCNFRCKGCYANDYKREDDLPFELVDKVVTESKELGVSFFTMLGGEPFIWGDLLKLFEKHNDAYFQVYTNGSLINENIADKLLELGNVAPMISLEGFGEETDKRRGKGTYEHLIEVMSLLKNKRIPFGYSVLVTRNNVEEIVSDKFVDMMLDKGAYIGWYFLYMPIGKNPDLSSMPTPEQRKYLLEQGKRIRNSKPLFIIDFWNDAPSVGGCIAGKFYIHVNSAGDVEPCIFTHFAQDNIRDKSLKEILQSDFFKAIRKRQPYNENLLLPCMLIDNPEVLRDIHKEIKIKPTHQGAENLFSDELKEGIDKYSKEVKKVYAPLWEEYKKRKNIKRKSNSE